MSQVYLVTPTDLKLLDESWERAKVEIEKQLGGNLCSGKSAGDTVRKLHYVLYSWISDVKR